MLMAYGLVVFSVSTAAFDELQRRTNWRHASTPRQGLRPANQFVGLGDDTISLKGEIAPDQVGDAATLDELREMADAGLPWPLVDGTGKVYGAFVVDSLDETHKKLRPDGSAALIEFDLALHRIEDADALAWFTGPA